MNSGTSVEDSAGAVYLLRRAERQHAEIDDRPPLLEPGLDNFERNVRAIIDACQRRHVRAIFTTQPVLWRSDLDAENSRLLWFGHEADGKYLSIEQMRRGMDAYNDRLRWIRAATGTELIDLGELNGDRAVFYDDCHFTETGARRAARIVADWILAYSGAGVRRRQSKCSGRECRAMTAILGISAFYHDSAAALVVDGRIVAAAQEERFTRKKHDHGFPQHAVDYCLAEAGINAGRSRLRRLLRQAALEVRAPARNLPGLRAAPASAPSCRPCRCGCEQKLHLPRELDRGLGSRYRGRYVFTEHHESHAASAFFPSPFDEAAILTLDGVGEWATASFGVGRGNRIELTHELRFPHSLGLLYSAFTYFSGFRVNCGEYKLMGLAPYGQPIYEELILEKLIDLKRDGSFRMDMSYFNYCQGLTMTSREVRPAVRRAAAEARVAAHAARNGPGRLDPGR